MDDQILTTQQIVIKLNQELLLHQNLLISLQLEPIDPTYIQQIKEQNAKTDHCLQLAKNYLTMKPNDNISHKDLLENYNILQQKYRVIQLRLEDKNEKISQITTEKTHIIEQLHQKYTHYKNQSKQSLTLVQEQKQIVSQLQTELNNKQIHIKVDPPPVPQPTNHFDDEVIVLQSNNNIQNHSFNQSIQPQQPLQSTNTSQTAEIQKLRTENQNLIDQVNKLSLQQPQNSPITNSLTQLKTLHDEAIISKSNEISALKNQIERYRSISDEKASNAKIGEFPPINLKLPKKFIEFQVQNEKMRLKIQEFNEIFEEVIELKYFGQTLEKVKADVEIARGELENLKRQKAVLVEWIASVGDGMVSGEGKMSSLSLQRKNASFVRNLD